MSRLSILVFSALLCLTWGWEPGTQYVYNYAGRSINGIYYLKQQNAVIEIRSHVTVQSHDDNTLVVKLTDGRIKRNGKYEKNPYINGDDDEFEVNPIQREEIEGQEDPIANPEHFGAPFVVTHNKGSFTGIKVGADEPLWVVNYKKSIASQLQLDLTGVRPDSEPVDWSAIKNGDQSATFNVFEDSITGDCSSTIAVHRMPMSKVYAHDAYRLNPASFEDVCKGKPVYEIIKTKDFNRCLTNPVSYSAQPATYLCSLDKAYCSDWLQRKASYRYVACGDLPNLTYLSVVSWSDLVVKPFAIDTKELTSSNAIRWELEKKEGISSRFSSPSNAKEHKTLSFVLLEFEKDQDPTDTTFIQPKLEEANLKCPIAIPKLQQTIYETLRYVAKDLKDKPDSQSDNLQRLAITSRALTMFSLEELRGFWEQIKHEDSLIANLFVDTVVQSGSNPAIMLIKEIIQNKEIPEIKSIWTVASLGYHAKTPTTELLHELMELYKSSAVQSSKSLKQTTLVTLAELFNAACGDIVSPKRFPYQLGDLCDKKDPVVLNEFLPQLVKELKSSNTPAERIVVLTAVGSFGTEEILPILLPYIRGSGDFNDTAERVRAVLSLHRVVYVAPEKVHPILAALASNTEERPEVRMAAISLLFTSNAPFTLWQNLATSTWYERSQQIVTFTSSLIKSLTGLEPSTSLHEDIVQKARHAWTLTKRVPTGSPFSVFDIETSSLDNLVATVLTQEYHVAGEQWPAFFGHQHVYQLGPIISQPLTILFWNYNMGDIWQTVFGKPYSFASTHDSWAMPHNSRARESGANNVKNVWDELKVSPRPSDKRVGLLQVKLMGSISRFYDLEKLYENIPNLMNQASKFQDKPYEVNLTKYGMLAEYNVKFPTEMGLPMRFLANLPVLVSLQGTLRPDGHGSIKSDISAELGWKLSSELRVELPFNGNYAATGVDVRVEVRAPRDLSWNWSDNMAKLTWTPGVKVTDLFYYHVKPYTVTRNVVDSFKPTLEDEKASHIISVTEQPIQRDIPLGDRFGVNVHLLTKSELEFSDFASWMQWFQKWNTSGIPQLGFIPLDLQHREYVLRYKPEGTKARAVQTWFQYQQAIKSCPHTVIFQAGESQPSKSSSPEITSDKPIAPEFKPAVERLFKDIESGKVNLLRAGLTAEQKDGTFIHFNSTLGVSKDSWNTKDFVDWRVEKYSTVGPSVNANKQYDYALCYSSVSNWNKPPHYGFSKDVLYMTADETISFGEHCDQNRIRIKGKAYRDDYAAKHAMYSPMGQECQKDMAEGFMYGSPACEQARYLDQTYNNYEMTAEVEKELPAPVTRWLNSFRKYVTHVLYPFTLEQTFTNNAPNRANWNIRYNPYNKASNMTFVFPTETLVAHNVRELLGREPWSQFYSQVGFPVNAGTNLIRKAANVTTGGASEDKCFVGPKSVYTFDGSFYNYTVDQCEHILLTDCSQKSELAVTARQEGSYKVVKVVYLNDTIELNPTGYVVVNGAKFGYKGLDKESRFEIRNNKEIKAVIYPILDGVVLEVAPLHLFVKIQGSHVEMTSPLLMPGEACGMCGDFNQEVYGEFKTPERCTLSAGELMAASFKLASGQNCNKNKEDNISRRLSKETEKCTPVDVHYQTYLPEVELNKPTKCTRYEKLTYEGTYTKGNCQSVEYSPQCQPGCKPHMLITKPFTFKCSGAGFKDFTTVMTVPSSCITNA